jgi:predicted dehydrogenase
MDKVKVAVIGAGALANAVHYPSLSSLEDVEIVAVCDRVLERLNATADRFGIVDRFSDYHDMLDRTRPDAVYALMPPHHLFDVAMDVLSGGYHLFVEKPPAVTTHQTEAMARLAESKGLVTAVGFQRRYHPLVRACYEKVREAGTINQVVSCFYKNLAPHETHPYYRGAIDILRCDAIHAVDALRYYAGLSEVAAVASEVRTLDGWYAVSFNSLISFKNGVVGVLLANWCTGRRTLRFEFHAAGGPAGAGATSFVEVDDEGLIWVNNQREPAFRARYDDFAGSDAVYVNQGFRAEARAFIDAVKAGTPPHNSLQDAVESMRLADMIYQSAINQ